MSKFSFDARAVERAVMELAEPAVRKIADDLQRLVDDLAASHAGRPVDEVKVALRSRWQQSTPDGDITDPELTEWATAISEGRAPRVQYDGLT